MLVTCDKHAGAVYLSMCWLCPKFLQFIHPSSHLSLSQFCNRRLQPWNGACEMPVIHYCDSGWAMSLSCSRAPAEAQFPFVLWCIDPFRPPPECTPLALTPLKPACAMDLRLMLAHTRQLETELLQKTKRLPFLLSCICLAPMQPVLPSATITCIL